MSKNVSSELRTGIEPISLDYKSSASPTMLTEPIKFVGETKKPGSCEPGLYILVVFTQLTYPGFICARLFKINIIEYKATRCSSNRTIRSQGPI
jgi:hypothetical protein